MPSNTVNESPEKSNAAVVMVMVAMVGLALKGIFAKLAYYEGLSVTDVLVGRVLLATPVFWLIAWGSGHHRGWGSKADLGKALGLGVVFLIAAGADFAAVDRLGAGPSRVLLFSYPGWVLVIEAARRRRVPQRHHMGTFAVAWVGLCFVSTPGGLSAMHQDQLVGVGFAVLAAISYACFTAASQGVVRRMGSVRFVVGSNTGAALALFAVAPWLDFGSTPVTWAGAGWLIAMAWLATVGPVFLTFDAIRRIGAERVSLLMLLGPVVTLIAANVILSETLTIGQLVGTVLVVGSIGTLHLLDARGSTKRLRG